MKFDKKEIRSLMKVGKLTYAKLADQMKMPKEDLLAIVNAKSITAAQLIMSASFFNVASNTLLIKEEDISTYVEEYLLETFDNSQAQPLQEVACDDGGTIPETSS